MPKRLNEKKIICQCVVNLNKWSVEKYRSVCMLRIVCGKRTHKSKISTRENSRERLI